MADEVQAQEVKQEKEEQAPDLVQMIRDLSKEIQGIKESRFTPSEIRAIAQTKPSEEEIKFEEDLSRAERERKILEKEKTDRTVRNIMWERALQDHREGRYPPNYYRSIASKGGVSGDSLDSHLLGVCLLRELGPMFGIPVKSLDKMNFIESEKDFNRRNIPANLIREFRR